MGRNRRRDLKAEELEIEQEVRERAYERFLDRANAGEEGDELLDWVAAEAEVLARRGAEG